MLDVFLSYSHSDSWIMRAIKAELKRADYDVWVDENLNPGDPTWTNTVQTAIEQASCLVVILTENAKQSDWVKRELEYAAVHDKTIISLLASGDERTSIPLELISAQRIDIRTNYEANISTLKNCIRDILSKLGRVRSSIQSTIRWDRTGSIFWLNTDMQYFMADVVNRRDAQEIKHVLRQIHYHVNRLELGETIASKARRLKEAAEFYTDSDWTSERREQFQIEIHKVFESVQKVIISHDPDWIPMAPENQV